MIRQGFHYARTCRSLWLFGFFVGIASGGSGGGSGRGAGSGGGAGAAGFPFAVSSTDFLPVLLVIIGVVVILGVVVMLMHFVSEGALIEGIVKAREGGRMTTGDGFRAGWTHWGVLLRIALIYFAMVAGSLLLLAAPVVLAIRASGGIGATAVALGIPAIIVAVPWLITLYLVQAFAARIAVIENRRAIDAIRKARLFLHGRLMHGLKLIVATFVGTVAIGLLAAAVMLPVVLLLVALVPVLNVGPVIAIGCMVVFPVIYVLVAMLGTFRSSVWTIGYVTEVTT
ncbi:MAG: hypothetical protein ABS36_04665 [Acidobacteria bacterium SCN 69-37]|nr:MAG: hypothetical protein ABS36_04665 [Acidobacteria bacterium SCN 69-37]